MVVKATLDEMEELFKSLEDIEVKTKTVINNSVTGIETLLDMMSITSQNGRESNQENLSSHKDNAILLLDKDKARISTPQALEFKNFIKTPIRTARVYKIPFIIKLRLLGKDWEQYMIYITAW